MSDSQAVMPLASGLAFPELTRSDTKERRLPADSEQLPEAELGWQGAEAEAGLVRHEERFRASEKRFRDLFEGSPDAIFVEDLEGTVLDVNPAACCLHGFTLEELLGKNVLELVPPRVSSRGRARL